MPETIEKVKPVKNLAKHPQIQTAIDNACALDWTIRQLMAGKLLHESITPDSRQYIVNQLLAVQVRYQEVLRDIMTMGEMREITSGAGVVWIEDNLSMHFVLRTPEVASVVIDSFREEVISIIDKDMTDEEFAQYEKEFGLREIETSLTDLLRDHLAVDEIILGVEVNKVMNFWTTALFYPGEFSVREGRYCKRRRFKDTDVMMFSVCKKDPKKAKKEGWVKMTDEEVAELNSTMHKEEECQAT